MAKTKHCQINNYKMRQDAVQKVIRDHFQDNEITVEVSQKQSYSTPFDAHTELTEAVSSDIDFQGVLHIPPRA